MKDCWAGSSSLLKIVWWDLDLLILQHSLWQVKQGRTFPRKDSARFLTSMRTGSPIPHRLTMARGGNGFERPERRLCRTIKRMCAVCLGDYICWQLLLGGLS